MPRERSGRSRICRRRPGRRSARRARPRGRSDAGPTALEAFDSALEPGASLIGGVRALEDEAGAMHDAIVAADRARSSVRPRDLTRRQRRAIDAFADPQAGKAADLRPAILRRLRRVRSDAFRESLGRAVAGIGHVTV